MLLKLEIRNLDCKADVNKTRFRKLKGFIPVGLYFFYCKTGGPRGGRCVLAMGRKLENCDIGLM